MRAAVALSLLVIVAGCESSDPEPTGAAGQASSIPSCAADELIEPDNPACTPLSSDYQPRDDGWQHDTWPACISDDNAYHPFDTNISTNARIKAFEEIAGLLGFGKGESPSAQAFVDARVAYSQPEGLDSRLSRREDVHYPAAPKDCRDLTAEELAQYPDRCVGPATLQPLLVQAFADGARGIEPALQAARIEAALLWFLYASVYKEASTCAKTVNDCDSSTGYYAGGQQRESLLGLAGYVQPRSKLTHERIWDGLLAVRCWRDLDPEATNTALRDQALAQLDRALDRGLASIVRQRLQALPCETAWESVRLLYRALDRAATERDADKAAVVRAELARDSPEAVDVQQVDSILEELFPCP